MSKSSKPSSSANRKNPTNSRPTTPRTTSESQAKTPTRRSSNAPTSNTPSPVTPISSAENERDNDELLDNLEENETREEMEHDTSERDAARRDEVPNEYSNGERLHKLIARAGLSSRRAAEEIIASGRVLVNGKTVSEPGAKADPVRDRITVDGQPLHVPTTTTVVLMHKPLTVVSTKKDPEGRTTVTHLLPEKLKHLHPIGRLDYDTSGLLFLTDDGSLTQLLTHPSHGVEKTYWARVRGTVTVDTLKKLEAGIYLEDGKTAPAKARVRAQTENNALVQLTLREGRNRQVRRMLEAVGHPVRALRRVRVAGFGLDELLPGQYRVLLPGEVHALRKAAEAKPKAKPKPARAKSPRSATRDTAAHDNITRHNAATGQTATGGRLIGDKPIDGAKTSFVAPQQRTASRADAQSSVSRDARSGFGALHQGRERSSSVRPTAPSRPAASGRPAASRSATSSTSASAGFVSPRATSPRAGAQRPAASSERSASGERFSSSALTQRLERQAERREREHPLARRVAQSFEAGTGQTASQRDVSPSGKGARQAKPTRPPKPARVFAAATAEAAKKARIAAERPKFPAKSATKSATTPKPSFDKTAAPKTSRSKPFAPEENTLKTSATKANAAKANAAKANAAKTSATSGAKTNYSKPTARRGERPWGQKTRKRA